jgi:hypothetical protein
MVAGGDPGHTGVADRWARPQFLNFMNYPKPIHTPKIKNRN